MALALILATPAASPAAPLPPGPVIPQSRGGVIFHADVFPRPDPGGRPLVDVLVEVPASSLRFTREGADWAARFDVTLVVFDRGNNQVNGDLWTVSARSADPTGDQEAGRLHRRRFLIPVEPGRLRFEMKVTQTGSGLEGEWSQVLEVPRYDTLPMSLSRPIFGRCDLDSAAIDTSWAIGRFSPSVRRRYGDRQPEMCVRGEIFDRLDQVEGTYTLKWEIRDAGDGLVDSATVRVTRRHQRGRYLIRPPVGTLAHGNYRLRLSASLAGGSARAEEPFQMDESRLDVRRDPEMIRGILGTIATNEELVLLERTPPDSLESYWQEFWKRRDPTPGTAANENLREFMRRVEHVNAELTALDPGWRTDMGRIYIRYGPPDEVERVPYSSSGPPYEVWYYRARSLRFVFVDREGFGRFRLVGSPRS